MPREIDPKATARAAAFALWMKAPNPMVTFLGPIQETAVSVFPAGILPV